MNPASPTPEAATAPATLAEQIRTILAASAKPITMAQIKTGLKKLYPKGTKKDPRPPMPLDGDILRELNAEIAAKRAFEHPGEKYGKDAPPVVKSLLEVMEDSVRTKLKDLEDAPFAASKLGKPTAAKGAAAMEAFETVVAKLVAEGKLFELPKSKYSIKAPAMPLWYTVAPHKTAYNAIMTNVGKILGGGITGEQLLAALRTHPKLGDPESGSIEPPVASREKPQPKPEPQPAPKPPTDLRGELKKAYDQVSRHSDGSQAEVRAVYHRLLKLQIPVGVPEFHECLWAMHNDRTLELLSLNEVAQAQEPELAVRRNGHLYYYMIWN